MNLLVIFLMAKLLRSNTNKSITSVDKLTNRLWLRIMVLFGSLFGSICRWMPCLQVHVDITATESYPMLLHAGQANLGTSGGKKANPEPQMAPNLIFFLASQVIY